MPTSNKFVSVYYEMENFELSKQGAEAKIYRGEYLDRPAIAKERFVKKYRISDLDNSLTKERMKAECRAIVKCKSAGVITPTIYLVDFSRRTILMEYFQYSLTAKDFIIKANDEHIEKLSKDIGMNLAKMHQSNIVHGDLTTSNILVINKQGKDDYFTNYNNLNIAFIDFGLAQTESTVEHKGVDLYVLERALLSTHSVAEQIFPTILKAYKSNYNKNCCNEILAKFEDVRMRGRKRTMVG